MTWIFVHSTLLYLYKFTSSLCQSQPIYELSPICRRWKWRRLHTCVYDHVLVNKVGWIAIWSVKKYWVERCIRINPNTFSTWQNLRTYRMCGKPSCGCSVTERERNYSFGFFHFSAIYFVLLSAFTTFVPWFISPQWASGSRHFEKGRLRTFIFYDRISQICTQRRCGNGSVHFGRLYTRYGREALHCVMLKRSSPPVRGQRQRSEASRSCVMAMVVYKPHGVG